MIIKEIKQFNVVDTENITWFLRVDPENLSMTLQDIFVELRTMSWLDKFEFKALRDSFRIRAEKTCDYLEKQLLDDSVKTDIKERAGEYIVSNLSKSALVKGLKHQDIPLMELLGRKRSNNPGFDFYTEKYGYLVAGEAKYVGKVNAYNSSLKQICDFIVEDKHIQDIGLLLFFTSNDSIEKMNNGTFGVCAGFSSTNIDTNDLIDNIKENKYYKECIKEHDVFLVAVDMYGK